MDKLLLYNAAKMYYADGKSQQEISNIMGLSRPQISRLLKEARSCHIVEITLNPPYSVSWEAQADKLRTRLGLSVVRIVNASDYAQSDTAGRIQVVSEFAAQYLQEQFPTCRKIGVGWGRTIYATVLAMEHAVSPCPAQFVPLVGNAGFSNPTYQTNSIVDRAAEKCKAQREFINTPAFVPTEDIKQYMLEINGLDHHNSIWDHVDLAFFSLGGPPKTQAVTRDVSNKTLLQRVLASNAVGDILGNYFDAQGQMILEEDSVWCVTMPPEQLKKIGRRICIALGSDKVNAICTAAKMGLITELITDHYTAEEIADHLGF
jgi:deoxyribonucleoside regulator